MIDSLPLDVKNAGTSFIRNLELFLNYTLDHKMAFSLLLQQDPNFKEQIINSTIAPILMQDEQGKLAASSDPSLRLNYIAAGSLYLVEKWLRGDFESSPREVASYLMEFAGN